MKRFFKNPFWFGFLTALLIGGVVFALAKPLKNTSIVKKALAAAVNITGQGTVNFLAAFAGGTPSNQIGDSIIYDDGAGHIGIGTTNPDNKLDVNGGVTTNGSVVVNNGYVYGYNNAYPIRLGELWGQTGLWNGASHAMLFGSDAYFQFLNRSGGYGPPLYAQDYYSNAAGAWMSQLCRQNGVNCPTPNIYDSGWFPATINQLYSLNHGLGATPLFVQVFVRRPGDTSRQTVLSPQFAYGYSSYGGTGSVTITSSAIYIRTFNLQNFAVDENGGYISPPVEMRVVAWKGTL